LEKRYAGRQREGRIQSAERASHLRQNDEGYDPSFSLIRADSSAVMKGKVVMDAKNYPLAQLEQYKKQAKDLVKAANQVIPERCGA